MNEERFNVVLTGTPLPGRNVGVVVVALSTLIKRDVAFATRLLSGHPTKLKSGVDAATGARYVQALEGIGAAAMVEPETLEVDTDVVVGGRPVEAGATSIGQSSTHETPRPALDPIVKRATANASTVPSGSPAPVTVAKESPTKPTKPRLWSNWKVWGNFALGVLLAKLLSPVGMLVFLGTWWLSDRAIRAHVKARTTLARFGIGLVQSTVAVLAAIAAVTLLRAALSMPANPAPSQAVASASAPTAPVNERAAVDLYAKYGLKNPNAPADARKAPDPAPAPDAARNLLVGKWACRYTQGRFTGSAYPVEYRNNSMYNSQNPPNWNGDQTWELLQDGSLLENSKFIASSMYSLDWISRDEFNASDERNVKHCLRRAG